MSAGFPLGSLESWNPGPVVGRVCGLPGAAAQGPPQADEASNVQILQGKLPNLEFLAGSNNEHLPQLVAGCDPLLLVTLGDLWLQVVAAGAGCLSQAKLIAMQEVKETVSEDTVHAIGKATL